MRDIRTDLRERLRTVLAGLHDAETEYDHQRELLELQYRDRVAALGREKAALEQLLAIEDRRAGIEPTHDTPAVRLVPLADFLVTKVHAHGPMAKDRLRIEAHAAGYFADKNGRTFHITLRNIERSGRVVRLPDGCYAFRQRDPSPLFGMGEPTGEGGMQTLM